MPSHMHCCTCVCRYNVTRRHMDELCESIISLGYQFIVIDCPAGIDVGFINAISPAKEALIVTTPEITSIRDAGGFLWGRAHGLGQRALHVIACVGGVQGVCSWGSMRRCRMGGTAGVQECNRRCMPLESQDCPHDDKRICCVLSTFPATDRVAGLLEANGIYNVKLLVNRVRPDMIQKNDMMSVKDVQEMLGIPLLGAIPEDPQVGMHAHEWG